MAFELDAGCALSLVSEEKVVIAIAFYNVALDFLKKNPALTLANPNIGLALDALARAIARCIRVLAQQHRQNVVIIELIDAPILFIEEAAAPLLLPAPEVTHDADLTSTTAAPASASEATGSSPATTVPAVTPPPAPVNESEDFKIPAITAASVDATPRVAAATASAGKKKSSAPRAPYFVPRAKTIKADQVVTTTIAAAASEAGSVNATPRVAPVAAAAGKKKSSAPRAPYFVPAAVKAKKAAQGVKRVTVDKNAPPGLAMEKRSPAEVAAAYAAYDKTLDAVFAVSENNDNNDDDSAPPPGFSKPVVDYVFHLNIVKSHGTRSYLDAAVAAELGCFSTQKILLENALEFFKIAAIFAEEKGNLLSAAEEADLKLAMDTISMELDNFSAVCDRYLEIEEEIVADVGFVKRVLDGTFSIEDDKTRSYLGEVCTKFVAFIEESQSKLSNGDERYTYNVQVGVNAGLMVANILGEMELKFPARYNGNLANKASKLLTKALFAQGALEARVEAASRSTEEEKEVEAAPAPAPASPRRSVFLRLGSRSSGPTSGDSTPLSTEGGVVSLEIAATEVAAAKKRKPTRRGGKGKKSGSRRFPQY